MTELRLLEWRDVDFDGRKITIREAKGGVFRVVPINERAMAVLRAQYDLTGRWVYVFAGGRARRDGRPGKGAWDRNKPRREYWWAHALIPLQEKIPTFQSIAPGSVGRGWHLFRHTFASRAVQRGVPIFTLSKWLGHKDVKTTMIYAHLNPEYDPDIEKV